MKKSSIISHLFVGLLFTYAFVELASKITSIVDGLMVAQLLGETELAAFGLISPYNTFLEIASAILITGAQAITIRTMISGNKEKTDRVYSVAVGLTVAISLLIGAISYIFSPAICRLLGAKGNNIILFSPLNSYNLGFSLGIPFLIIFAVLSVYVTLDGNKKCVVIASTSITLVNFVLNYVLTKVFCYGMFGIGLASTLSRLVGVSILLSDLFKKNCVFRFRFSTMSFSETCQMLGIGMTKLTRKLSTMVKKYFLNKIILWVGGVASMTAMSARGNIDDFLMCIGVGISGALMLMEQVYYGEEDISSIKTAFKNALLWLLCGSGGLCLIVFILAPQITVLFGITSDAYSITVTAIRCTALAIPFTSLNEMLFDYLQAMRKFKWAHIYIAFQRLTILPVAYLLVRAFGERGFWWAFFLGEIPVTIGYVIAIILLQRKEKKKLLHTLLVIPKGFEDNYQNCLELIFENSDSPVGVSKTVMDFCLERGIDTRRANIAALCTEEMLCNIVSHGYTKDNKVHHCELRVVVGNELSLYFRDDCRLFNLRERYEKIKDSDIENNIGIKLINRVCSDVIYNSSLGANTLVLKL